MRHLPTVCGIAWALSLAACTEALTPALTEEPRIVFVGAEPPALVPPGVVTATVRVFDPEYRPAAIHWYLATSTDVLETAVALEAITDPASIDPRTDGLFFLGSGPSLAITVPGLPPGALPEEDIFDTLPAALLVSVDFGTARAQAIKQVRLVLPELVERVLARQLERTPTNGEIAAAMALRLNHNPTVTGFDLAIVPVAGEYTLEAGMDLQIRNGFPELPVSAAVDIPAAGAVRIRPQIVDLDANPAIAPGEPGFNKLESDPLAEFGTFFPLTVSEFDWLPAEFAEGSLFEAPTLEPANPRLSRIEFVVYDRQGGTAHAALEVDTGAPPLPAHRGTRGSALVAEGVRLGWLRVDSQDVLEVLATPGAMYDVTVAATYTQVSPHGVTAVVTAAAPTSVTAPSSWFDQLSADPNRPAAYAGQNVTMRVRLVRIWRP